MTAAPSEQSILTYTLTLRAASCKAFTACDLCPFAIDNGEDENYDCSLAKASKGLLGYIIGETVTGIPDDAPEESV